MVYKDAIPNLKIELLADHPEALPVLTAWFEEEWDPYYGPAGPGNAAQDLSAACHRDVLPIALVAFVGDELVGTAALKRESVSTHKHLTPWLAALLVAPKFRRRGVAEQLIAAVEDKAAQLSFPRLYVGIGEGSGTPATALRRRGWQFVEKGPYFVSDVAIYKKTL